MCSRLSFLTGSEVSFSRGMIHFLVLMANDEKESILRFTCDACGVHLGVDASLAGQEAPCPKCGKPLLAPNVGAEESETVPSLSIASEGSERSLGESRRRRSRRKDGYSERRPEVGAPQVNYKKLFQIVLFVSVVALIALSVTWYLQNQ